MNEPNIGDYVYFSDLGSNVVKHGYVSQKDGEYVVVKVKGTYVFEDIKIKAKDCKIASKACNDEKVGDDIKEMLGKCFNKSAEEIVGIVKLYSNPSEQDIEKFRQEFEKIGK